MPRESRLDKSKRCRKILAILRKAYPDARCSLDYVSPLQLLVSTILAAQCTDVRVNIVTKTLFAKYRSVADFAKADQSELEQDIRSTGFFRNKAKNIRLAAEMIVQKFGGKVPDTMDELLMLPGVARKTANVILSTAFGKNEGVIVDTHVTRLANRLGLTAHSDNQGDRIENDLMELVDRCDWAMLSHCLVFHGRACCTARKPDCANCPVQKLCPSAFKV